MSDDTFLLQRRRTLLFASGVLLAGLGGMPSRADAQLLGRRPQQLTDDRDIYGLKGLVWINDMPANDNTPIRMGDTIRTGADSELVAVHGDDAFLLRGETVLELAGQGAKQFFRLVEGAMLAVFGPRAQQDTRVQTPVAAIGIRGTGLYADSRPDMSYVCTCYGEVELSTLHGRRESETIVARHHDAPRYVLREPRDGRRIIPAGFLDHTDAELRMLEALHGRTVPFGVTNEAYQRPRRRY